MRNGNFLTVLASVAIVFSAQLFGSVAASAASEARPATVMLAQADVRVSNGPQVFLFKGLADIFSAGMDTLAAKLAARGIPARVANHSTSDSVADTVIRHYRAGGRGPVVIIGHSLGADAAVEMAQRLNAARVPVALVVGFGATRSFDIPPNVARTVNYYQGYKAWRGPRVANVNMDNAAGVNHFNIEKIDRLQNETVSRVIAAIGGGRRVTTQSQAIAPRM